MKKLLVPALAALGLCASLPALANTQSQTKNPIVLVPGIFAFDTIAGIDYWYQIPSALQSQGAKVHVPKINAFDSSAKRGESLIAQLEQIRAASGGSVKKFNLIGHSQGGLTARYVLNTRPDLVASVTTLNSPHKGSPMADIVTGVAPAGSLRGVAFDVFANAVGNLVNLLSNNRKSASDVRAMLAEFNKNGAAANNQRYPVGIPTSSCGEGPETVSLNGNSIRLYSMSGTAPLTNVLDISDPLFTVTSLAFGEANDGVTGRCSSHFGKVLKDNYTMNHLDVTNQVLGLVSLFETNPKTLFQSQANRLKNLGL
ncbi:lipase family alpha/beta hydrolase [Pseudomonas subflava]|uniref:lipase family alpha/beta hydrolase n=1 Tax=Pseudomonas subflava TaxID=2952933 RepID=UPI00207A2496|nr:triacylglycerol lipase [Pseudomonas subflava]HSX69839.1 triacylglycerol lipase [Pseudomonas sp.]